VNKPHLKKKTREAHLKQTLLRSSEKPWQEPQKKKKKVEARLKTGGSATRGKDRQGFQRSFSVINRGIGLEKGLNNPGVTNLKNGFPEKQKVSHYLNKRNERRGRSKKTPKYT